jgi:hypothetical protein
MTEAPGLRLIAAFQVDVHSILQYCLGLAAFPTGNFTQGRQQLRIGLAGKFLAPYSHESVPLSSNTEGIAGFAKKQPDASD